MGPRALAVALLGIAVLGGTARAQPSDEEDDTEPPDVVEGGIPADMERFELNDLTYTMRDDTFNTITVDRDDTRIAFVGTHQGRIYKTSDGGRTWKESTVIPEQRPLWAVPGGSTFLGAIRDDGGSDVSDFERRASSAEPIAFQHIPTGGGFSLGRLPYDGALANESAAAAGGAAGQLGVGLSNRAPRLQLLVGTRGRPAPGTNRARFLSTGVLRGTAITSIAVDPTDKQLMFAATVNGLYKSENGGESWARAFAGLTAGERLALRIAIRPGEPQLMILGTLSGMYTSSDRGENWTKNGTVGGAVNEVAFDTTDSKYVYLATNGGVLRSTDGGRTFDGIYYSSLPAENDVKTMALDPFDPETLYIGTDRGAYVTHKARTARLEDWALLDGVQSVEAVSVVAACNKHKGHIYAAVNVKLHTINYGADGPESAVIESWDGGRTWRQLFTGQSDGSVQWFWMDPKDNDQLWLAWTTALHKLERRAGGGKPATDLYERPDGPPLGELVLAALRHHGLELNDYADRIQPGLLADLLPKRLSIIGTWGKYSTGGVLDDQQFTDERYRQIYDIPTWQVIAIASWNLPERVYSPSHVPMMRQRVAHVNDELRHQLTNTVRRAYAELMRLRATLESETLDLRTHVLYRLRVEQLEAVIDLASGGYLTRWHKKRRTTR